MMRSATVLLVAISACGGSSKPTCETANTNIAKLTEKLDEHPAGPEFVQTCKADERVTQAMLECWSHAATLDALEKCPPAPSPRPKKKPPADEAKATAEKYAYEAYPSWAASHPDESCPKALADLNEYMGGAGGNDPWGHPYDSFCGPNLPPGAHGFAVRSRGPDGQPDTADDIKTWE